MAGYYPPPATIPPWFFNSLVTFTSAARWCKRGRALVAIPVCLPVCLYVLCPSRCLNVDFVWFAYMSCKREGNECTDRKYTPPHHHPPPPPLQALLSGGGRVGVQRITQTVPSIPQNFLHGTKNLGNNLRAHKGAGCAAGALDREVLQSWQPQ